ncbi:hypothetical protein [Deefgea rivuli]|uniref:hypothetical protein n=1 Tax=Deefgea rivuli TaxID=400948 RepID=UPI0004833E0E|nr:hypothetical protein [Deefgea rivuli]
MPELLWNPVEFLEALNVVPTEGEYGTYYLYLVEQAGLRLELSVYPLDSDISVKIYAGQQAEPIINLQLLDCPAARVAQDKRGQYIEFAAANAFTGRYDETSAAPYGFRLWLNPYLQIEPYSYPS